MTKERMFYIAYEICTYLNNRDMQKQFEPYEVCMYVAELVGEIECAIQNNNGSGLEQYYNTLKDEIENLCDNADWIAEVERLIKLLDEWKI